MESIFSQFVDFSDDQFFVLFFKSFAVLFSVSFLVYALVIVRQTQIMNNTLTTKLSPFLYAVSLIQVVLALLLIVFSLVLI